MGPDFRQVSRSLWRYFLNNFQFAHGAGNVRDAGEYGRSTVGTAGWNLVLFDQN
jgi:hypothetical protein